MEGRSEDQPSEAPERPLPSTPIYSVEYPGYVLPSSVSLAIDQLGGQANLDGAFRRSGSKSDALVELDLRPGNPFSHPIAGDVVTTHNILLKVVKRRRKTHDSNETAALGEYTAEAVGIIPKTVRFRSMADYQYQPDIDDPITQLRAAMDSMDVDAIRKYTVPPEREDYIIPSNISTSELDPQLVQTEDEGPKTKSNLRLFPPPLFSRQNIPQLYNYKANPASIISTIVDAETGEERRRLINKMRWKGYGPASILFSEKSVPDGPPPAVEEVRSQADQALVRELQMLFQKRPIWTRMSLFNQFSQSDTREIHKYACHSAKQDGPWRDTLVRFGYDPRVDVGARFYQRLYFRNANHPIERPSVITRRQDRAAPSVSNREETDMKDSHLFDGKKVTKETAAFQLCDIIDPMLKKMIEDNSELRESCHERDGWYSTQSFERIKTVLRHKFFSLLEGHAATDEECAALLVPNEGKVPTTRSQKLRPGKHNMAKGALKPEDAAAARLRATLDRNAKALQSQR